jgi:hypothetical protein
MAKTIDPAFQAAPFLGESSHDPIEFARRQNLQKFQAQKRKYEETQKNTAQGLENLMVEIKGWEDQEGFKEIMGEQDKIMNGFLDLSRKGLNLVSPKTTQEIMAYKAVTDAHEKLKQKVDTWNTQKGVYDMVKKAIEADSAKPPDDQRIDKEATLSRMQDVLKSKSIYERGAGLQNLIITKTQFGDVIKKIIASKDFFEKPTQTQVIVNNPETGQNEVRLVENITAAQEKENIKRAGIMYEGLDESFKSTITKQKEKESLTDESVNMMSDKDYFTTFAVPTYKKRFLEKPTGKSGAGFAINFGGRKIAMEPGRFKPEPVPYGDKVYTGAYTFPQTTKSLTVPVGSGGSEQFTGQAWAPIKEGTIEATLYLYDPATDEFVFNTTSNQNAPWVQNNKPVSIPRSVIGEEADDIPIEKDGKIMKLKDVYGTKKQVKKELPGLKEDFWNKPSGYEYKPKNSK